MTIQRKIYRMIMRFLILRYGNEFLACGQKAGELLYGKKWFDKKGIIIPNGIEIESYCYSEKARNTFRAKVFLDNKFLIGHVGHYVEVKNQLFLINLMPELLKVKPDAVLLLFGDGEMHEILQNRIHELNITSYVKLMGNVHNIHEVLSALDVFVFPSLFEGTPLALIEAQANGLPCIISDTIPSDACLTSDIQKLSLNVSAEQWIVKIINSHRNNPIEKNKKVMDCYDNTQKSMNRIYDIFQKYVDNEE